MSVSKIVTTEVVNARKVSFDVWIGGMSRGSSIWANPFSILEHGRSGAFELYENHIRNSPELIEKLQWLKGKRLGCYCAPVYCHGHILQKLINEYYG
jgi:hypothetical protein